MKHSNTIYEMTSITIYDPNGGYVHEATITKDARVFRQLGGEHYVELSLESSETLPLTRGCYVSITSLSPFNYFLKNDAVPEPIADAKGYKYVLKFYAYEHYMEACQIKWLTYGEDNVIDKRELTFSLTTSLSEYAKLIAANMNDHLGTTQWTIAEDEMEDNKYTKDMKELSFDGVSCWDAIGDIANAFGVEWWVEHTKEEAVIHFGKCEAKGDVIAIREGEVVNRFPAPKRGDDSNYGTRFYIYGGTQNIPENYSGSSAGTDVNHISEKRLRPRAHIDGRYVDYYEPVSILANSQIVEKTIILDNIFPKADTTIEGVREETRTINGVDNVQIYLIEVKTKPTQLGQLGITFTSGALMGRTFDAKFHTYKDNLPDGTTKEAFLIEVLYQIEGANGSAQIVVPNANLKPEVGDKYILTGVKLDDSSIQKAEVELYTKGCELAKQYSTDTNVYDCPVNPVYCQINRINFEIGIKVKLVGAQFGDGRTSRIQGYEKKLYNPYIATYNIGDNRTYSRWNVIKSELLVASAIAEKKQEREEQTLKLQVQSSTPTAQLQALQNEVTKLKGTSIDTASSVSIVGAKRYAEQYTNDLIFQVNSGEISPTRLLLGGVQEVENVGDGFWIKPSSEYKSKYKLDVNYQGYVELNADNAKNNKGVCVFIDTAYTDKSGMLGVSLSKNDLLISDGKQWRKISSTSTSIGGGADTSELEEAIALIEEQLAGKQDTISDIDDIRAGAALGETALQEAALEEYITKTELSDKGYVTNTELNNKGYVTEQSFSNELDKKVDKVQGKQLSTEDFTTELKEKLENLQDGGDGGGDISNLLSQIQNLKNQIAKKQDKLYSGTNIKTILGKDLLGTGDVFMEGTIDEKYIPESIARIYDITQSETRKVVSDIVPSELQPYVYYELLERNSLVLPQLAGESKERYRRWMLSVILPNARSLNIPYKVHWSGKAKPNPTAYALLEMSFTKDSKGNVYGEWKSYDREHLSVTPEYVWLADSNGHTGDFDVHSNVEWNIK